MSGVKALVVSDSHGNVENMCRAVELARPDMILHLGDGWRDAEILAERYPGVPLEKVPGNCDYRIHEQAERVIEIADTRIFLCHGHTQGVKTDLGMVLRTAVERKADAVLFGHTHRPLSDIRAGVVMLNPGSIGDYRRPTYGTLTVEDGKCLGATHVLK